MPYEKVSLPAYPVLHDVWDSIKEEERPIMIYGMGNGADKLLDRLSEMGVSPAEIFASDGFVRGHSFRGKTVRPFSYIKENYDEFVILLSFASNRTEVLEMLTDIDKNFDLLIPDMPVAGVDEYFDKEFYNANYELISAAYSSLADEDSKSLFASVVRYKLEGKMSYLEGAWSSLDEMYSTLPKENIRSVLDVGAYNGDTLRQMKEYFPNLSSAVAIEPDPKTYRRLVKYVDTESSFEITAMNVGAWCEDADGIFQSSSNRNSSINATASYENVSADVRLVKIDSLEFSPDYIKYDVEGAEREALLGSYDTITRHAPALLVSLYHRSRDIFDLVLYVKEKHPDYKLYLRRLRCLPAWELNLIATT